MFFAPKKMAGLLLLLIGMAACQKEPQYQSPQKFLSQAPWRVVADSLVTVQMGQANDTENLLSNVPPCVQDNLIFFDDDGSYRQEEGALKCSDSAAQSAPLGRWEYDAVKKVLLLDGAGRLEWEVLELNNSTLKLLLQSTFFNSADTIRRIQTRTYNHP